MFKLFRTSRRDEEVAAEPGQIIVLFALAAVVIIAMVGLVLDGGDTFAQRRHEQNAADLAATAGANAYLNTSGSPSVRSAAAIVAANQVATRNGYTNGVDGASVAPTVELLSTGARVRVNVTDSHQNLFARVVPGQEVWNVSVTAAAMSGSIDTAVGAAPWLMHIDAFNPDGSPVNGIGNPRAFGESNGDYPLGAGDIAWTDFNGSNNVNTSEVRGIIEGTNVVTATMAIDQYVGQHNQGNHTALYGDVNANLVGDTVPIPVTGPCPPPNQANQGCFKGWARFVVLGASGGSDKTITGYFLDDFVSLPLTVGECTAAQQTAGSCGVIVTSVFGAYTVRLSD